MYLFLHLSRADKCSHGGYMLYPADGDKMTYIANRSNHKTFYFQRYDLNWCVREWSGRENKQSQDSCHRKSCPKVFYYICNLP